VSVDIDLNKKNIIISTWPGWESLMPLFKEKACIAWDIKDDQIVLISETVYIVKYDLNILEEYLQNIIIFT
jgi:hypothetical protein